MENIINFKGAVDFYSDLLFIPFVPQNGDCYWVRYIVDENDKIVEKHNVYIYIDNTWILLEESGDEND